PLNALLIPELEGILFNPDRSEFDHRSAAMVLASFAEDDVEKLADLVLRVPLQEYSILISKFLLHGDAAKSMLLKRIQQIVPVGASVDEQNKHAKQQAHAAVTLLDFGETAPVKSMLAGHDNPIFCTYTEDRVSSLNSNPELLLSLAKNATPQLRIAI